MMTSFLLLTSLTTHLELAENGASIDHLAGRGKGLQRYNCSSLIYPSDYIFIFLRYKLTENVTLAELKSVHNTYHFCKRS